MKQHDNDMPAFPVLHAGFSRGMTLRDYFAAAALQGWIASNVDPDDELDTERVFREHAEAVAKAAYVYADAMLEERDK